MSSIVKTPSFKLATYAKGNLGADKVALVLPGRLDTKDYPHMRSHVDFLATQGYYAVSFDPPGTWDSPGPIELYTLTNYLKAINELIEVFGNKPTLLLGHSRGGSMAMVAGMANPCVTHFIAVCSQASASSADMPAKAGEPHPSYRDTPPNNSVNQKRFDLPYNFFEDAAQYDAVEDLKHSPKPKLFFLGLQDVLVKPEIIKDYYQQAAAPKKLYELDTEHDYRRHPHIIEEVNRVVGKFINQN